MSLCSVYCIMSIERCCLKAGYFDFSYKSLHIKCMHVHTYISKKLVLSCARMPSFDHLAEGDWVQGYEQASEMLSVFLSLNRMYRRYHKSQGKSPLSCCLRTAHCVALVGATAIRNREFSRPPEIFLLNLRSRRCILGMFRDRCHAPWIHFRLGIEL